jgi:hypothetical protein
MCSYQFHNELRYWQLPQSHVKACCAAEPRASYGGAMCMTPRASIEHEPLLHYNAKRHVSMNVNQMPTNRVSDWRRRRMSRYSTKTEDSVTSMLPIDEEVFDGEHLFRER